MRRLLIAALILAGTAGVRCQERYVLPVDEASRDASFLAFREKLIAAADRRDAAFVLSIVDPKIELSFGGDAGLADFKRIWKIGSRTSPFWEEFLRVIKNGGRFSGTGSKKIFYAPYTFDGFPADLDPFEYQTIFGSNVNLRERPDPAAPVVASLSYNIVRTDYENSVRRSANEDEFVWLKVETLGGRKGFVKANYVRSPIDYRAAFEKKRGVWKMTAFIAGD